MNVTYWDACIGIEIGILSPEAQQDFRNASAPKVRQVFSFFDIANLLDVCEEIRDSIKESGQFSSARIGYYIIVNQKIKLYCLDYLAE